jgi:hypothetical protein
VSGRGRTGKERETKRCVRERKDREGKGKEASCQGEEGKGSREKDGKRGIKWRIKKVGALEGEGKIGDRISKGIIILQWKLCPQRAIIVKSFI